MFIPPPPGKEPSQNPLDSSAPPSPPKLRRDTDVYAYVDDCPAQGCISADIIAELIARGYTPENADYLVENAATNPTPSIQLPAYANHVAGGGISEDAQAGRRNMLIGGDVFILGLLITVGTLAASSGPRGGPVTIAWGAILFGVIQFVRGAAQMSRHRQ